jgi:hypothetical protein
MRRAFSEIAHLRDVGKAPIRDFARRRGEHERRKLLLHGGHIK